MARPRRLTREMIVATAEAVLAEDGTLSMARLGERLGVDPSAVYRHVGGRDEIVRAVGDRLLVGILDDLPESGDWREAVAELCRRLRAAHLGHPDLSALVRDRPPLQENEVELTEVMLAMLDRAGFGAGTALAYHALIELTIGSAVLDAAMTALGPAAREHEYCAWREHYAGLGDDHPASVAHATRLYRGSPDDRFEYALARLLDGLDGDLRHA